MNVPDSSSQGNEALQPEQPFQAPVLNETARKGQTLLVVEDEVILREVEVLFLRNSGYQVLEAGCVAEALQMAAATMPIHLLLTDHSLPDGNGVDLARRFRTFHPQAAILLVSGSVTELDGRADGLDHIAMLEKPFQFDDLLRVIPTLLAGGTPVKTKLP
jgi:DNA-binding response OmpR family regulator